MSGSKQNNKLFSIITFPRIHITLIGMDDNGYRINGSIGFSIADPKIEILFEEANDIEVNDERERTLTDAEKTRLCLIMEQVANDISLKKKIKSTIKGLSWPHYGFGTNTAIYLSCIEALLIANEIEYYSNDVVTYSKRGGTSGIGINTYFNGGFIFDVGIKNDKLPFKPSSIADRNGQIPLVMQKCELPDWEIGICIPTHLKNKTEQEEIDFFETFCPIDKCQSESILYEAVYGISSSILERDYDVFCKSINNIQSKRWKFLERSLYGKDLIELEEIIKSKGADCVGMSSFGPLLFFMGENLENICKRISKEVPESIIFSTSLNNKGRIICNND